MARIRSIKPEYWSSPGVETLDPFARLLFIAMWNWADDNGVGVANPRELLGFAFPLDDELTVEDIRRWLVEIRRVFGVQFYEVTRRPYFAIPSWEDHQKFDRRSKGKYPTPDEAECPVRWLKDESSTESHEPTSSIRRESVAGTGEEGNRGRGEEGTGEQSSSSEIAVAIPRPEIARLLDLLDSLIVANGAKKPTRSKRNVDAIRLMLDVDKIPEDYIERAIRWCQADEFWRSNILSASKLREKYDQLRLAAERQKTQRTDKPTRGQEHLAYIASLGGNDQQEIAS